MKTISVLSLFVLFAFSAFAQAPSKATILSNVGDSWVGTMQGNMGNWYAKITLLGDGKFDVTWANGETTTHEDPAGLGHGGGNAANPLAANMRDFSDGSVVRVQWNTINDLEVEWWPNRAAQAGQRTNKPAHMKGVLKRKAATVLLSCSGSRTGANVSFVSKSGQDIKLKVEWDEGSTFMAGNLAINNGTCADCQRIGGIGRPHGTFKIWTIRQTNPNQPVSISWGGNAGNIKFCTGGASNDPVVIPNK